MAVWLAAACLLEAVLRVRTLAEGASVPAAGAPVAPCRPRRAGAVVLRTLETLVPLGWAALAPLVVASGALVWIALAAVALNLAGAMVVPDARRGG